jgi:uncharacterized protein YjiS (DUF1127 family)
MSDHLNASAISVDFTISRSFGLTTADRPIGRAMRIVTYVILRAWARHLTRRSGRAAALYLHGLDDEALAGIGLRRAEIPSAVRQLEAALLDHGRNTFHGDIQ